MQSHLLHLKVEVEQSRVAVILQDCRAELDREMRALSGTCTSERVIKEHRVSVVADPVTSPSSLPLRFKHPHACISRLSSRNVNLWRCVRRGLGTWRICVISCLTTTRLIECSIPPEGLYKWLQNKSRAPISNWSSTLINGKTGMRGKDGSRVKRTVVAVTPEQMALKAAVLDLGSVNSLIGFHPRGGS